MSKIVRLPDSGKAPPGLQRLPVDKELMKAAQKMLSKEKQVKSVSYSLGVLFPSGKSPNALRLHFSLTRRIELFLSVEPVWDWGSRTPANAPWKLILHTNQTKCSACDIRRFCDECLISGKTKTIYETHTISEDMDTTKILLPIAGVLVAGGLNPAIATIKAMNIWDISVTMSKACGIVVPL